MRYNRPNSPLDNLQEFVRRGGIPVTTILLALSTVVFFAAFFSPATLAPLFNRILAFGLDSVRSAPWTVFTYPIYEPNPFSWLIGAIFFWLTGGSLERSWGSARFAAFFSALTAITAASLLVGCLLLQVPALMLFGFFMPLSALIVAFCMLNPEQTIVLYFFPIRAKYVAILVTFLTLISYGSRVPLLGLFACGGIIAAVVYMRFGRPWADIGSYRSTGRRTPRGPDLRLDTFQSRPSSDRAVDGSRRRSILDLAGRYRDWQEKRRLERLWKNSGFSESEPEWRDDKGRRR